MPALLKYQFHLIARIDNTIQVTLENICMHDKFASCLERNFTGQKCESGERCTIADYDGEYGF
jgi:hypothetical protein